MDRPGRLELLIKEATMDCYNLNEAVYGFLAVLEDNLRFPFAAKVVGEEVEATGLDVAGGVIVAECRREGIKYRVSLLSLEFNPERVDGSEWLESYMRWVKGQ